MEEEQIENVDSPNDTTEEVVNTVDLEETVDATETEDVETLKQKLAEKEEANRKLFERAKKAEGKLKSTPVTKPADTSADELRLIARGLSDEEIEEAQAIAKGKDIPLAEAVKTPLFLSYQKDLKDKERKEKAKLGASRGSGEAQEEVLVKPNMTREEHIALFNKVGK